MRFLVTAPDHDSVVTYLSYWAKPVLEHAERAGHRPTVLPSSEATKKNLESRLGQKKTSLVFFNGHGTSQGIYGHDNEALVEKGVNEDILKDTIVFARACSCAQELGPAAVSAGAKTFIGYSAPFMFPFDSNMEAKPLSDEVAKPCLETSNVIPHSLLKGDTVASAMEKTKTHSLLPHLAFRIGNL